jgi:hemolysin III
MHPPAPQYTRSERLLDGTIHGLGVIASLIAIAILLVTLHARENRAAVVAGATYAFGFVAMIWCSAAYNSSPIPSGKSAYADSITPPSS